MKKSTKINRRKFVQTATAAAATAAALTSCSTLDSLTRSPSNSNDWQIDENDRFDFIIVGSGAGGGPLACGLAKSGYKVLLLEAGGEETNTLSKTPVFHAKASEDALLNWSYFVDRFESSGLLNRWEAANTKFQKSNPSVYYPRAAGVGGCTRVNALINLYPDNEDWANIANLTGDKTWNAGDMYRRFQGMQSGNGGWLTLNQASPLTLLKDRFLTKMALSAAGVTAVDKTQKLARSVVDFEWEELAKAALIMPSLRLNPNDPGYVANKYSGLFNMPFNAINGVRHGVREYILETRQKYPKNLFVKTQALCSKVLFDPTDKTKAIGVEFTEGAHQYRADIRNASKAPSWMGTPKKAFAKREIILSGGAFNTPQLLMLSGIGNQQELDKHGIPVVKNLPGVGLNLQDRYEVTVVSELNNPISLIQECTFAKNNEFDKDPCWLEYKKDPKGHLYGTNGVALSVIRKSSSKQKTPDLCIFGVPGKFTGYYPGYDADTTPKNPNDPSYFTWAILKGHTKNHAGTVKLKSTDPRDTPNINFAYFKDEKNGASEDLDAVFQGLNVARRINSLIGDKYFKREVYPGDNVKDKNALNSWIMKEAWGHHASCTNKMGRANDPTAVVDSKFRVHGVKNLRVVDASIYPDIPGLFIMLPTLIVSEKAKEVILADHANQG
jgi:choline dehydrogenase